MGQAHPAANAGTGTITMRYLALSLALILASCATPPRAIIPAPSVVAQIDPHPVAKATTASREAVREIAKAGDDTRMANDRLKATSQHLTDAIDRAEKYAESNREFYDAYIQIQKFSLQLSTDLIDLKLALDLAQEKEGIAITTIDLLETSVRDLEAATARQSAEIRFAKQAEKTLLDQVQTISQSSDKLAIAADKLSWWRWYGIAITAAVALSILIRIFGAAIMAYARPRIPFLT
jgi:hypothetical protein